MQIKICISISCKIYCFSWKWLPLPYHTYILISHPPSSIFIFFHCSPLYENIGSTQMKRRVNFEFLKSFLPVALHIPNSSHSKESKVFIFVVWIQTVVQMTHLRKNNRAIPISDSCNVKGAYTWATKHIHDKISHVYLLYGITRI